MTRQRGDTEPLQATAPLSPPDKGDLDATAAVRGRHLTDDTSMTGVHCPCTAVRTAMHQRTEHCAPSAPNHDRKGAAMTSPDSPQQPQYLDVHQAATYLGTGERFIRRLVAERRIVFYKVGKYVRFAVADLDAFAQSGRVDAVSVNWHGGQVGA